MLEMRGVSKTFNAGTPNEMRAMCDVDVTIEAGAFVIVIGTNGSGKSTLLNAVAGSFGVDSGTIRMEGRDISRWPEHRRARLIGRVFQTLLSMLVVISIVFFLTRLSGNPIHLLLDVNATERDQEILTRHLGLDKPLPVQYGLYVKNIALGDFGTSILTRRPVTEHIRERLAATVELGFVAMLLSVLIGIPLGMYSAVRRGGAMDTGARVFAVLGQSMPTFWLGLMLILFFGVVLGVLPAGGRGSLSHLILPAFTLGYFTSAAILRLTRSSMLEVLGSDYIKFARLKGLHEQVVLWKHGLRNALLPVVTFAVMLFVQFLGGAVVTETVFAWPGLGRLILESITTRDYPIVQAGVLVLSGLYLAGNLMVDLLYSYLNPRIRHGTA